MIIEGIGLIAIENIDPVSIKILAFCLYFASSSTVTKDDTTESPVFNNQLSMISNLLRLS